jgi:flagellar P-ring protein precursor FlgI
VVGGSVSLGPAAIAHGNLNVAITTSFGVSQPLPFSRLGQTIVVPNVEVNVQEGQPPLKEVKAGTTVAELVSALNSLGASPRDLISILQALKLSGALQAELEVM